MANYFPSESGSHNVRGDLTYTTSQTATKVTVNASAILQVNGVYGSGYELTLKVTGATDKVVLGHKDPPAVAGWTTFLQTGNVSKEYTRTSSNQTVTIVASFVGKKSGDYFAGSGSGSKTITITIPKLDTPTVTQSLSSKTGSTVTMAWSSNMTIDSVWYSINGGTSWTLSGSVNASSGTYTITGLSGGTTYSIKTRLRGKDSQLTADSSALSVTTYAAPTISQSLNKKTDTTITINWTSNLTCDYLWYSKNGGTSWTAVGSINSSSGSFTISGLTAETTYSIKTRVRGKDSQLTKDSSALSVTTYGYATVTQSVSSKTAASITMAWTSDKTIDYVWYSKNGGSSWTSVGSVNATSGSYTISGLANETTYQIITRVRRADSQYTTDSSVLSVTTYGYPTVSQSLSSKTETTITIAWESQQTIDYLWYSTDNGTNWTGYNNTDGKSGTYTISGLSAYTNYKVKTRLRRKDSQLTKDSSALSITTYDYPHPTKAPSFTIGNALTVTFYNPLLRSISIKMTAADGSNLSTSAMAVDSFTGFKTTTWQNFFYASIPSATSGTYTVTTTYSGVSRSMQGGTYSVNRTESKPTMGTFSYADTNSTTTNVTQNNQKIVQNLSTVRYTLASVAAQNSASISSVSVSVNGSTYALSVSGSNYVGGNAGIDSASNVTATVTVTDSRGLTASKSVTVQMLSWSLPSAIVSLSRLSNYYTESYLKADAIYSSVGGKNSITITYTGQAVPQTGKTTPSSVSGSLTDNVQITLNLDNGFDWRFTVTLQDVFGTTTYNLRLARGTPIMFWDDRLNAVGVAKFPSNPDSIEFDYAYYGGKSLSQYMFTPKQTASGANLSSAGWYRVMHLSGTDAYTRGNDAWCIDLTIGTQYGGARNSFHKITLVGVYNTFAFVDETSKSIYSNENPISKIRYMTDGSGNGYIDIYYDTATSNRVTVDFVLRPLSSGTTEAVAFTSVNSSPAGETQRAEYTFSGIYNEYDDRYYKSGDTYSALSGMSGYCDTGSTTIVLRFQMPKNIAGTTATLNSFIGRIRHVNGGYADGVTGDWMGITGVTVAMTRNDTTNEFIFTLTKSETFKRSSTSTTAITANTPVYGTITPSISFT